MLVENVNSCQALPSVRIAGLFCQQITQITQIIFFLCQRITRRARSFVFVNGLHEFHRLLVSFVSFDDYLLICVICVIC